MAYQMAATAVTSNDLEVIYRMQTFSNAIHRTFAQHFTRFQLTVCSHGSSALAELLVQVVVTATIGLMSSYTAVRYELNAHRFL